MKYIKLPEAHFKPFIRYLHYALAEEMGFSQRDADGDWLVSPSLAESFVSYLFRAIANYGMKNGTELNSLGYQIKATIDFVDEQLYPD